VRRWKKTAIISVLEIGVLLVVHAVLLRWLSTHEVVSTILAAGSHVPTWMLFLTGVFLIVRFLAVFALPGMILLRLGQTILDWRYEMKTHPEQERRDHG
jgi:hypothetical protein